MTTNINDECDGGSDDTLPRTCLPRNAASSPSSYLQAYLVLFPLSRFSPRSTLSCSRPWSSSPSSSHAFWLCHIAVLLVFVLVCIVIAILLVVVVSPGTLVALRRRPCMFSRQSCMVLRCNAPCMCPATVLFVCIIFAVPVLFMIPSRRQGMLVICGAD